MERIAIRFADHPDPPVYRVLACAPAVRIFKLLDDGKTKSLYAHNLTEVDEVLNILEKK